MVITHAGLGTVKECILCGVPMIVFPIDMDQPDNAKRVVYHGLGASGDLRRVSASVIASLVEQADGSAVRDNVTRMQQCFLAAERSSLGARLIEEILPSAGRRMGSS